MSSVIPFPSVESQRGMIGIETRRAQMTINRPPPDVQVDSEKAVVTAHNRPGRLDIDHTDTDNALTGGKPEAFWHRIYQQYRQVALDNLQYIVDKGNRMGDLRTQGNPIPAMALNEFIEGAPDLQVFGEATPRNIQIRYTPNDLNLQVQRGQLNIRVQTHKPEVSVVPYSVRIYMEQYPKLTIIPPNINVRA